MAKVEVSERIVAHYERLALIQPEDLAGTVKKKAIGQDRFIEEFAPILCAMLIRALRSVDGVDETELPRLYSTLLNGPTASGKTFALRCFLMFWE